MNNCSSSSDTQPGIPTPRGLAFEAFFRAYRWFVEREPDRARMLAEAEVSAAKRGFRFSYEYDREADEAWDGFGAEPRYFLRCMVKNSRGGLYTQRTIAVNELDDPLVRITAAELYAYALDCSPPSSRH